MSPPTGPPRRELVNATGLLIVLAVIAGFALGYVVENLRIVGYAIVAGWGAFVLQFLWRIARSVEHLAQAN